MERLLDLVPDTLVGSQARDMLLSMTQTLPLDPLPVAIHLGQHATALDSANRPVVALPVYRASVGYFAKMLKWEPEGERKQLIVAKMQALEQRAKALETFASSQPGASLKTNLIKKYEELLQESTKQLQSHAIHLQVAVVSGTIDVLDQIVRKCYGSERKKLLSHRAGLAKSLGDSDTFAKVLFRMRVVEHVQAKRFRETIEVCNLLLDGIADDDPVEGMELMFRAEAYQGLGYTDAALRDMNDAVRRKPTSSKRLSFRGMWFASNGRFEEALRDQNEAIRLRLKADCWYAWVRKAQVMNRLSTADEEFEQVIEDLDHVLENDQSIPSAFFHRGCAHLAVQHFQLAIDDFSQCCVDEDVEEEENGEDGGEQAKKKKKKPEFDFSHFSSSSCSLFGTVFYLPPAYCMRALCFARLGEFERASKDLSKSFELDTSFERMKDWLRRVEHLSEGFSQARPSLTPCEARRAFNALVEQMRPS